MNTNTLVQKLWNYCNVLRDDGMSYGDYVEQLTYLLFLKMADERTRPPYNQAEPRPRAPTPGRRCWRKDGDELFDHYRHTLEALGKQKGTLGADLRQGAEQVPGPGQAAPRDRRPDRRRELVVHGRRREGRRLRGPAGEERAGHQERRRPVLHAARADPGDGGLHRAQAGRDASATRPAAPAAFCSPRTTTSSQHNPNLTRDEKQHLKEERLPRLGAGAGHRARVRDEPDAARHRLREDACPSMVADALAADPGERFDVVLANPPFGKKSSTDDRRRGRQARRPRRTSSSATTSGPPPPTSSSTSCSTSRRCSSSTAAPRWWCRTTCCSKAARARPSAASCCTSATCTPCCACPPACSTRRA